MGYIYKITNLVNNKIYIGQTLQPIQNRWYQHISTAFKENSSNKYAIHYAIRKYGIKNFSFDIIEEVSNDFLNERECYWIKELNTHISNHNGYNMTFGGEGRNTTNINLIASLWKQGLTLTEISKETGYSRVTCSMHLKSLGFTTKDFFTRRENYNSKKFSNKIFQYSLQGKLIKQWNSLAEIKRELNYEPSLLSLCINRKVRTAYGYLWVKNQEEIQEALKRYNELKYKKNRPVNQYSLEGEFIQQWESAELAGKFLKIDPSAIRRCCNKIPKYKTSKGYKWEYA